MSRNALIGIMAASVIVTTVHLIASGQSPSPTNYIGSIILFLFLLFISLFNESLAALFGFVALAAQLLTQGPVVARGLSRATGGSHRGGR